MQIINTKDIPQPKVKILVHAPAGAGKTRLSATVPNNIVLSAEAGLLSLRDESIDTVAIKSLDDLREAHSFLASDKKYEWVTLDSISEIAETVLAAEKKKAKDVRQAYGEMQEIMTSLIRSFRDLDKNVYFSAKQERTKDEITGGFIYSPSAPGTKVGASLPYFFDECFALHTWRDEEGNLQRRLQTQRDNQYEAKDRSGALDFYEVADLGKIYQKITNPQQPKGE